MLENPNAIQDVCQRLRVCLGNQLVFVGVQLVWYDGAYDSFKTRVFFQSAPKTLITQFSYGQHPNADPMYGFYSLDELPQAIQKHYAPWWGENVVIQIDFYPVLPEASDDVIVWAGALV